MDTQEEKTKGLRYNQGKRKWSLVDYKSLEPMIEVLEYGAKKYTLKLPLNSISLFQLCQKYKSALIVKEIKELSLKDCATLVMSNTDGLLLNVPFVKELDLLNLDLNVHHVTKQQELKTLLWSQKESKNIKNNIDKKTDIEKKKNLEKEKDNKILHISKNKKGMSSCEDYPLTELPKIFTYRNAYEAALYVKAKQGFTSIIVIKHEDTEVFFAVNAIKESDCLMMILKCLQKLSLISKDILIENHEFVLPGEGNWKKGLDKKEILESMQRHLGALMDGQDNDPETNLSHMGHIMCNAMFYSYFEIKDKENIVKS